MRTTPQTGRNLSKVTHSDNGNLASVFIYLFERETERERDREREKVSTSTRRVAEEGGDAGSLLSSEPRSGLNLRTLRS